MTEREVAIKADRLSKSFGDLRALDELSLEVEAGEIFGLVGPDGAGKTTTLRLLCGLMPATSGAARVAGFDLHQASDELKDRIGYMPQRFALYPDLSVDENLSFFADLFGLSGPARRERSAELLKMTRLEPFRNRAAGKLSGGMKQKLGLMCALLHRPRILFLDEPTNGVDPVSRRDFWKILYDLLGLGVTVFVTTAYLDEAERCNRVGLLYRGQLIECDDPLSLMSDPRYRWFSLKTGLALALQDRVRAVKGVHSAELSGAELRLCTDANLPVEAGLRGALVEGGDPDAEVRPLLPSLEDVFVSRIRDAGERRVV